MKKALIVGINSYPTAPLRGCVNDAEDWWEILTTLGGYAPDNVRVLCDDRATTEGIKHRMDWLLEGITGPGDEVFFQYSGHGSQIRDRGELDELADHMDEILCPVDLDWKEKVITDDDIGTWVRKFPAGTKVYLVLDCCHSGTGTRDLRPVAENPHYKADRYLHPPLDIELRGRSIGTQRGVIQRKRVGLGEHVRTTPTPTFWEWLLQALFNAQPKPKPKPKPKPAPPKSVQHVLISGCRSDQTSADAFIDGRYNGALTRHLINEIKKAPNGTITAVQGAARQAILSAGFTQESQLEGPSDLVDSPLFS